MARTTTNYGFNISEGTDLVNPLTDIFPNFEDIDTDLKAVSDSSVTTATELKTGTVHALTRADGDRDIIRFTATANFTAGETFTVDGVQVTALTTAGEQLTTGCYIIGSEVLCALKGTLLTFYISQVVTDATTLEGHSASYFATATDLSNTDGNVSALSTKVGTSVLTTTAQDCSGAINEINANLSVLSHIGDVTELYGGSTSGISNSGSNIVLSDRISNYKKIVILTAPPTNVMTDADFVVEQHVDIFKNNTRETVGYATTLSGTIYGSRCMYIDETTVRISSITSQSSTYCHGIYGIK